MPIDVVDALSWSGFCKASRAAETAKRVMGLDRRRRGWRSQIGGAVRGGTRRQGMRGASGCRSSRVAGRSRWSSTALARSMLVQPAGETAPQPAMWRRWLIRVRGRDVERQEWRWHRRIRRSWKGCGAKVNRWGSEQGRIDRPYLDLG